MNSNLIKIQKSELIDALVRNVTDNFNNVSFTFLASGCIQIRVILNKQTEIEDECINDLGGEFEAQQDFGTVEKIEVFVGEAISPLEHVVFNKCHS